MTPLAQYFAAAGADEFTPLRASLARKAPAAAGSASKVRPLKVLPKAAPAPAPAAAPAPVEVPVVLATPAPRVFTEPRVPLRELEAERAAFAAERETHAEALAAAAVEAEAARAASYEQGLADGRAAAEADAEIRLAAAEVAAQEARTVALDEMRRLWTVEQGDRLADLLILQMAILEETVKLSLKNVVGPLALDVRRRQTVDELVGAVRTIALDGAAYRIAASGPADLLGALEERLGDDARLLSFETDEAQTDVRIDADATVIESRLSSWRLALEEALS